MKTSAYYELMLWRLPVLGLASVVGGFLLQFTMGTFYSFGNMMTYMVSYMRQHGSPDLTYADFVVVQSTWGMTQGVVMPLSGFLIEWIGPKMAMTAGATIFSSGCALTYITINKDLWMVAATYGFVAAFGQNIALIPTLTTAMKWFPDRKGTAMGVVVGGFGGGALVFNQIQTAILNPGNVAVATSGPDKGYFTDADLLARVPGLLLILAGIYFVLGLTGAFLIIQPPEDWLTRCAVRKMIKKEEKAAKKKRAEMGHDPDPDAAAGADTDGMSMDSSSKDISSVVSSSEVGEEEAGNGHSPNKVQAPIAVSWRKAFRRYELYLLWVTRLSVVLITQVIAALYKAFGQTFIYDDHFLSMVGAVSSLFNCSGRLLYGFIMDKTSYKVGMSIEAVLLTLLMSTLYLTSLVGQDQTQSEVGEAMAYSIEACKLLQAQLAASDGGFDPTATASISSFNLTSSLAMSSANANSSHHHFLSTTSGSDPSAMATMCDQQPESLLAPETPLVTKVVYALWVWSIFLTFPGTFSMQPAVTAQTFGHRHAGTIYAFLFSSDIINNLMVATFSKYLQEKYGYLGLFLIVSLWGIVALIATLLYPKNPSPSAVNNRWFHRRKNRNPEGRPDFEEGQTRLPERTGGAYDMYDDPVKLNVDQDRNAVKA